ncbi:MAG: class I SAM-dependent RNA methyltransferase [Chloroflexi bacterium]|nr:class I SAM-dependent RNA methyltransferase [Chloroflexota bacterium]
MTEITLRLQTLVYGGDALARDEGGRAVFVPFGLPGELVRAEIVESRARRARARPLEVLEASPERVPARCRHFGECGGCHYQHLDYPAQLRAKRQILIEQLTRLGGFADPPVDPTLPSPAPWNYRNRARFSLAPDGRPGYQAARSNRVVPISECHILEPALTELWPQLELDPDLGLDGLTLLAGSADQALLILEAGEGQAPEVTLDLPLSVVYLAPGAEPLVLAGDDHLLMEVLGRPFRVSADSFFQVNTPQAEEMVRRVLALLNLRGGETVLDLYCGVGLFSAFLAPHAGRLIGVEAAPAACADYVFNLDQFDNVELYEATVEQALPALAGLPVAGERAAVLDPPRAGLAPAARQALLALAPPTIVYVSCDPATLARDLSRLTRDGGYTLLQALPLDLFPHTYHIESISLLKR